MLPEQHVGFVKGITSLFSSNIVVWMYHSNIFKSIKWIQVCHHPTLAPNQLQSSTSGTDSYSLQPHSDENQQQP
jgi:hypothetical protein